MFRFPLGLIVACLLTACGGTGTSTDAGTPDASVPESIVVEWGPIDVPAETEDTRCVIKRLGNAGPIRVHEIHNQLEATSHHFILSGSTETEEMTEPSPCFPFSHSDVPLMITQKPDDRLTLPNGVGFTLPADALVAMELHFINVSAATQPAQATTTFYTMPDSEFEHEAAYVFLGGDVPRIAAQSEASSGPTFIALSPDLQGANFFAIAGHEHQWGTNVSIATTTGPSGPDTPVYEVPDFKWDEPETVFHDPPFVVPTGGGFRIRCDWFNGSDSEVSFGLGVDDEMCFFWAYYFLP